MKSNDHDQIINVNFVQNAICCQRFSPTSNPPGIMQPTPSSQPLCIIGFLISIWADMNVGGQQVLKTCVTKNSIEKAYNTHIFDLYSVNFAPRKSMYTLKRPHYGPTQVYRLTYNALWVWDSVV